MDPASQVGCLAFNLFSLIVNKIRGISCNNVVAVVLPNHAGKTELTRRLQSDKYHLLDIENQVALTLTPTEREQLKDMNSSRLFYYPKCKKYLDEVKLNFKHEAIIVLCSNVALCKYLKIKKVFSFIPNNEFLGQMAERTEDAEDRDKH
jgi:hypothetical protein